MHLGKVILVKLIIDYDMLEKIRHSKEGIKASESFMTSLKAFKEIHMFNLCMTVFNIFSSVITKDNKHFYIIPIILEISIYSLSYNLCKNYAKRNKNNYKNIATFDLDILVNQLYNLEVKTTTELLKESKVIEKNYEINYKDNKPILIQRKYISVPLCNGYDETLLQEHNVGSRKYELSVQSPIKKYKFKLAKASIDA